MAFGFKSPAVAVEAPPPPGALRKSLPLLITLVLLAIFSLIAYNLYQMSIRISHAASERVQAKNVVFTKDGMRVGVKEVKNENYVDRTQGLLVKAWNLSGAPGSATDAAASGAEGAAGKRKPHSTYGTGT